MMQIDFQFPTVWMIIFMALLAILIAIQLLLIFRKQKVSPARKTVRIGLNILFLITLILLVLKPYIIKEYVPKNILVHDTDVSQDFLGHLKDSLNLEEKVTIEDYEMSADRVYLVGQHFTPLQLGKLQRANVTWIPYQKGAAVTEIRWNGLLRQGQTQTIYGTYETDEERYLSLRYGDEVLDSVRVYPNHSNFRLTTQAKAIGRNQLTLISNGQQLGNIRFYVTENDPIHYQMRFSYPDMEIRRLSEWLGKKGQGISATVQTSSSIIQQSSNIESSDTLQFVITEPTFANSTAVKEALASGSTILFTNFSNVDRELLQINRALGTEWSVNRSHTESNRIIDGPLTALPYRLLSRPGQWDLFDAAVGYQRIGTAKVGISLLEATFPLALQGDSVGYAAVWDRILYAMRPDEGTNYHIPQPLFVGLGSGEWTFNSDQDIDEIVSINEDSIYLSPSPINPRSHTGYYHSTSSGWITLADSLEVYFQGEENDFHFVRNKNQINQFIRYHQEKLSSTEPIYHKIRLSDWYWFAFVLISVTLLWIEPRVGK